MTWKPRPPGVVAPLVSAMLLGACARPHAPSEAPAPRAAPTPALAVAPVTDTGYHNETSVAVSPRDPSRIIAAYQVPATVAASADSGRTWRADALPATSHWELSGDPSVIFDEDGRAYALYIAFDRPEDYDTLGAKAHRNGIFVNRSDDGGRSWRPQPTPVLAQPERAGVPFEDKPMMTVDRSADLSRRGHLYVAWTEFRRHESVILFSRSRDEGASFEPAIEISDRAGSPKDSVGADEGTDVAVAPDGTIYVVWSDSTGIRLDRSSDGGTTFGADRLVARTADIVFGIPGVARANGYPALEVDPRTGRLYIEWVDRRLGHAAVFLTTSDDGGATWSTPILASGDGPEDCFFAWMSVDATDGRVVVGYYRALAADALVYTLAWSGDGGRSFQRRQWSAAPFAPGGEFLGDYTGVDAYGGAAYAAWAEVAGEPAAGGVHARRHATRVVVGRARF